MSNQHVQFQPLNATEAMNHFGQQPQQVQPLEPTQVETQANESPAIPEEEEEKDLWGYLYPCNDVLQRIDFWRTNPTYKVGRNPSLNQVVLPGPKISNSHCKIHWDGEVTITILDTSTNGVYLNSRRMMRNETCVLRNGDQVGFGGCSKNENGAYIDYRFIFRQLAGGRPKNGLYAEYDTICELGKGSFATVLKAIHRATGTLVAVKQIYENRRKEPQGSLPGADSSSESLTDMAQEGYELGAQLSNAPRNLRTSVMREIMIMRNLQHPNITELKTVFFQPGTISLVLELVEGGDLLEKILAEQGMGEPMSQHITYQLCDALRYLHQKGVAHRDLKPENILLTKDDPPVVRLADFGLAKVADSVTRLKTMCGTPAYLAPEVILQGVRGTGYEPIVDSWSVGVIVFSMLTCMGPFFEDESQDITTRIRTRTVQWHLLVEKQVSHAAFTFLVELLQANPDYRSSIDGAMRNQWLQAYYPVWRFEGRQAVSNGPRPTNWPSIPAQRVTTQDVEVAIRTQMNGGMPGDVSMSLDGEPSMSQLSETSDDMDDDERFPPPSSVPSQSQGGPGGKLQRRARIMDEAAEGNGQLPQPSADMIRNARLQERGKRRRDEDSAMIEERDDNAMAVSPKKRRSPNSPRV